ncbi:MAG TPA: cyanophycinase [Steroidobacteraceae bacterium]|nr:cyanophycinase [Steroidobacteraceae bacterium]
MRKLGTPSVLLIGLFACAGTVSAQSPYDRRPTIGPDRGWLVIDGGGLIDEVRERFVALAGGQEARIVAIPTAITDGYIDADRYGALIARVLGVKQVTVLHTRDRALANSVSFVEPLKHATGVWIDGGRQWRLADAYLGTAVEREIKGLLERGGVVGGSSAGATIQGSFLVRGAAGTPGNPDGDNTIMMSPGHEAGFGLLADSAIDQHVDTRAREADLDIVIAAHPQLLGIGLDEGAGIIVHGNSFFVVGGEVLIHDGKQHGRRQYYPLSPGQAYDLQHRTVEKTEVAADRHRYPLTLTLDSATHEPSASGAVTIGTGILESSAGAQLTDRKVSFACGVDLFSIGGIPHPARLDGPHGLTILARDINGDTLQGYRCRID